MGYIYSEPKEKLVIQRLWSHNEDLTLFVPLYDVYIWKGMFLLTGCLMHAPEIRINKVIPLFIKIYMFLFKQNSKASLSFLSFHYCICFSLNKGQKLPWVFYILKHTVWRFSVGTWPSIQFYIKQNNLTSKWILELDISGLIK